MKETDSGNHQKRGFSDGQGGRAFASGRVPSGNEKPGIMWTDTGTRNKRTVWTITSEPFPGAHFATMPTALARTCILAGTSDRGACLECRAPWERMLERTPMEINRSARAEEMGKFGRTQASGTMTKMPTSKTIGWRPTCSCNAAETMPCTVLDPFAGTGTTGLVALQLARDFISVELNPEYAQMARKRIASEQAQGKLF